MNDLEVKLWLLESERDLALCDLDIFDPDEKSLAIMNAKRAAAANPWRPLPEDETNRDRPTSFVEYLTVRNLKHFLFFFDIFFCLLKSDY